MDHHIKLNKKLNIFFNTGLLKNVSVCNNLGESSPNTGSISFLLDTKKSFLKVNYKIIILVKGSLLLKNSTKAFSSPLLLEENKLFVLCEKGHLYFD